MVDSLRYFFQCNEARGDSITELSTLAHHPPLTTGLHGDSSARPELIPEQRGLGRNLAAIRLTPPAQLQQVMTGQTSTVGDSGSATMGAFITGNVLRNEYPGLWGAVRAGDYFISPNGDNPSISSDGNILHTPDLRGRLPAAPERMVDDFEDDLEADVDVALEDLREDLGMRIEEVSEDLTLKVAELEGTLQEQLTDIQGLRSMVNDLGRQLQVLAHDVQHVVVEWREEEDRRRFTTSRQSMYSRSYDAAATEEVLLSRMRIQPELVL